MPDQYRVTVNKERGITHLKRGVHILTQIRYGVNAEGRHGKRERGSLGMDRMQRRLESYNCAWHDSLKKERKGTVYQCGTWETGISKVRRRGAIREGSHIGDCLACSNDHDTPVKRHLRLLGDRENG